MRFIGRLLGGFVGGWRGRFVEWVILFFLRMLVCVLVFSVRGLSGFLLRCGFGSRFLSLSREEDGWKSAINWRVSFFLGFPVSWFFRFLGTLLEVGLPGHAIP